MKTNYAFAYSVGDLVIINDHQINNCIGIIKECTLIAYKPNLNCYQVDTLDKKYSGIFFEADLTLTTVPKQLTSILEL
jgi:hypothetical protein